MADLDYNDYIKSRNNSNNLSENLNNQKNYIEKLQSEVKKLQQEKEELWNNVASQKAFEKEYEKYKNGIIVIRFIRCNNPNCICHTQGKKHGPYPYFRYSENGKTRDIYLRTKKNQDDIVDLVRANQKYKKKCAELNKKKAELKKAKRKLKTEGIRNDA